MSETPEVIFVEGIEIKVATILSEEQIKKLKIDGTQTKSNLLTPVFASKMMIEYTHGRVMYLSPLFAAVIYLHSETEFVAVWRSSYEEYHAFSNIVRRRIAAPKKIAVAKPKPQAIAQPALTKRQRRQINSGQMKLF